MASRSLRALSLFALASLLGCGGGTSSTQDAANDSAADAPTSDSPAEATATEAAVDAAVEASPPSDGAPDAQSLDAASEATVDAPAEASSADAVSDVLAPDAVLDVAVDASVDAPLVMPTVVATGLSGPGSLAITGSTLVFAQCSGQISSVPLSGGAVQTLATGQGCVCDVGAFGGVAYWVSPSNGTVLSRNLTGGAMVTIATGEARPVALVALPSNVVWGSQSSGVVRSALTAGGAPTTLATGQTNLQDLSGDPTSVYWTTASPNNVTKVGLAGGATASLVAGATGAPHSIVTGGGYVYWSADLGGGNWNIQRVAVAGGAPEVVLAPTMVGTSQPSVELAWSPRGILAALSGTPGMNDGRVLLVPLAGGAPTVLASAQATPRGITTDTVVAVWSNGVGNTILSVPY